MSYLKCLDYCGEPDGMEMPWPDSALNWLGDSTPDQLRIEEVLTKLVTPASELLHVGIGNSGLAYRFAPIVKWIDGITLGQREELNSVGLLNYVVYRLNKYHRAFANHLHKYDFIIDNNLGSYACCVQHFHRMMSLYCFLLKDDGMILTDKAGLAHAPGDRNWNLSEDIEFIADEFGLTLTAETEMVYAFRK
jgi:hypothetical protein